MTLSQLDENTPMNSSTQPTKNEKKIVLYCGVTEKDLPEKYLISFREFFGGFEHTNDILPKIQSLFEKSVCDVVKILIVFKDFPALCRMKSTKQILIGTLSTFCLGNSKNRVFGLNLGEPVLPSDIETQSVIDMKNFFAAGNGQVFDKTHSPETIVESIRISLRRQTQLELPYCVVDKCLFPKYSSFHEKYGNLPNSRCSRNNQYNQANQRSQLCAPEFFR
jgi:hypothetical protein